jgi:hypothetical protein
MSTAEVAAKARDLMEPVLGPDRTDRFVEAVLDIERFGPVKGLRPLLGA